MKDFQDFEKRGLLFTKPALFGSKAARAFRLSAGIFFRTSPGNHGKLTKGKIRRARQWLIPSTLMKKLLQGPLQGPRQKAPRPAGVNTPLALIRHRQYKSENNFTAGEKMAKIWLEMGKVFADSESSKSARRAWFFGKQFVREFFGMNLPCLRS